MIAILCDKTAWPGIFRLFIYAFESAKNAMTCQAKIYQPHGIQRRRRKKTGKYLEKLRGRFQSSGE